MEKIIIQKKPVVELFEGYFARLLHSKTMTLSFLEVEPDKAVPEHSHHNEQITNIIAGEFDLVVEGVTHSLKAGQSFVIPPNVPHSGRSLTRCTILDVFSPPRLDMQEKFY